MRVNSLLDKLQKGFVVTCIGTTAIGSVLLGLLLRDFSSQMNTLKLEQGGLSKEDLLKEGRETLTDKAAELKLHGPIYRLDEYEAKTAASRYVSSVLSGRKWHLANMSALANLLLPGS